MKTNSIPLKYDHTSRTVSNIYGEKIVLSPQCAVLLTLFLEEKNNVVTREHIRKRIWEHNVVSEDMINHLVCRLRRELNALPGECAWQIETIPKTGYRMKINEDSVNSLHYWLHRCSNWFTGLRQL